MFLPVPYVELTPGASCDTLAQAPSAGLNVCDDIVSINGAPVSSIDQLTTLVGEHGVGETVHVGWADMNGKHGTTDVRLTASTSGKRRPLLGVVPKSIGISKPP